VFNTGKDIKPSLLRVSGQSADHNAPQPGNTKGGSIIVPFDWFGISCMTNVSLCFHLQNRLIQTGGQRYSDTSPFSIPWPQHSEQQQSS
jgi:hypothetical protein